MITELKIVLERGSCACPSASDADGCGIRLPSKVDKDARNQGLARNFQSEQLTKNVANYGFITSTMLLGFGLPKKKHFSGAQKHNWELVARECENYTKIIHYGGETTNSKRLHWRIKWWVIGTIFWKHANIPLI